ncbi:MAG TPA: DUF4286 family protein [Gammaproteobacteria bacterium]|nr:DUF4286 family protein [Gammaproteobacteria bacterium]
MAIIYEVNMQVDSSILIEYKLWLEDHIADMLTLPWFLDAKMYEELRTDAQVNLCIHYHLASQQELESYFKQDAQKMRTRGERYWPHVKFQRRILMERNKHAQSN